jgi:glycosyltransferase involved in cell wall biosynthesis
MDDSFAIVLPYYNEAAYLRSTIASLVAQTLPAAQLILVDNGSTDGSQQLCRELVNEHSARSDVLHLSEPRPGKIHALAHAATFIRTAYVAFVDADTFYPPHYLATSARLFREGGPRRVAVIAKDLTIRPDSWAGVWKRYFYAGLSRVLYWQNFGGGCGQTFRSEDFRAAGGYSAELWPYALEDHEIMNRMRRRGRSCYHPDLWCISSSRRGDRSRVGWNFSEQLVYLLAPPLLGDWFFNRFLAARFEKRQIYNENLRQQDWNAANVAPDVRGRAA